MPENPEKELTPSEQWPNQNEPELENPPHYLFILTPPYSGSTALAKVLNTAPGSMILNKNAEGQRLVPGMCGEDRWNPDMEINWTSVLGTWNKTIRETQEKQGKIDLVIEKSPPNLVRASSLLSHFKDYTVITLNRNPYANCSSILHREKNRSRSAAERITRLQELAEIWAIRAEAVHQQIQALQPISFTYEQFCAEPERILSIISEQVPLISEVCPQVKIQVKDYVPQTIIDQNTRQIAQLNDKEKEAISQVLRSHESLLNKFGYTADWKKSIQEGGAC